MERDNAAAVETPEAVCGAFVRVRVCERVRVYVCVPTRTNKHTDMKQKWTTGPVDGLTPFSRTGVHCSDVYDGAVPLAFFIVFLFVLSLSISWSRRRGRTAAYRFSCCRVCACALDCLLSPLLPAFLFFLFF